MDFWPFTFIHPRFIIITMKKPYFSLKTRIICMSVMYALILVALLYIFAIETNGDIKFFGWFVLLSMVVAASIYFPNMVLIEEKERLIEEIKTLIEMKKKLTSNIDHNSDQIELWIEKIKQRGDHGERLVAETVAKLNGDVETTINTYQKQRSTSNPVLVESNRTPKARLARVTVIGASIAILAAYFFITAITTTIKISSLVVLLGIVIFWFAYYLKVSKKIKMFDSEEYTYEVAREMIMSLVNQNEEYAKKLHGMLKV